MKERTRIFLDEIFPIVLIGLLLLLIIIASGCSSLPIDRVSVQNATNPIYKYDIQGSINGHPFTGVGVIPYASTYDVKLTSKNEVDALTITSCHRDIFITDGWLQNYEYNFVPDEIENHGECLLKFGAYDKKKQGQNAWGIVDFETPEATLPATNLCNGIVEQTNGVSICQSKAGLVQGLIFPTPVRIASKNPACMPTTKDNVSWEYVIQPGECVIAAKEIGGQGRLHRAVSVGYTAIQMGGQ